MGGNRRGASVLWAVAITSAVLLCGAHPAAAWGPHPEITKAAIEVLPEADRLRAELGAEHVGALAIYCWMPDAAGQESPNYYVDDYLLIRSLVVPVGHIAPAVQAAIEPHFRRALQALRTEIPANACRQIGPILHYMEDIGAPPHTGPGIANHGPMENWVDAKAISITGYEPRLLGRTADEALAGVIARAEALRAFSAERAARAVPLVKEGEARRKDVEPILLESANESARAAADLLHTLFTVGLAKTDGGATLEGTVGAPILPGKPKMGARVILLDEAKFAASAVAGKGDFADCATDFTTVAVTAPEQPADSWRGVFRFRALTPGVYRVLAYRPGSRWMVSEPVTLAAGRTAKVEMALTAVDPAGNVLLNPDGALKYLSAAAPDRWKQVTVQQKEKSSPANRLWVSAKVTLPAGAGVLCGAALKDPSAKVVFWFEHLEPVEGGKPKTVRQSVVMKQGEANPPEERFTTVRITQVHVSIDTDKPLCDAIDRVWLAPHAAP